MQCLSCTTALVAIVYKLVFHTFWIFLIILIFSSSSSSAEQPEDDSVTFFLKWLLSVALLSIFPMFCDVPFFWIPIVCGYDSNWFPVFSDSFVLSLLVYNWPQSLCSRYEYQIAGDSLTTLALFHRTLKNLGKFLTRKHFRCVDMNCRWWKSRLNLLQWRICMIQEYALVPALQLSTSFLGKLVIENLSCQCVSVCLFLFLSKVLHACWSCKVLTWAVNRVGWSA